MARLRIRCSDGDRPTVQRRAEAVLRTMHWRPSALPASAILCIRRFPDPKPGTLRLDHQWSGDSTSWQRAAGEALDRFADKAARPVNGPVPANAEAVVFLDPAEMLACLARDWTDGSVGLRWWWRSLLRTTDPGRALLQTWLEAIEHAPAALQRLAEQGNAVSFVRALSAIQARTLLENVAHKFGLAALLAMARRMESARRFQLLTAPLERRMERPYKADQRSGRHGRLGSRGSRTKTSQWNDSCCSS